VAKARFPSIPLVRVIATRTILEKVRCRVPFVPTARRNERAALVRSILQAIQQNSSIQSVELEHLLLTPDLVTFVDTASSITTLSLLNIHYDMDMESAEREQGTRSLAVALQRNKNIQSLKMPCWEHNVAAIPILESLRSNTSVKMLSLEGTGSDETSHALQELLASTTSIQRFELRYSLFADESLIRPIAQAITRSESVSELKFEECYFHQRNIQSILQNKRNLSSLSLLSCDFNGGQLHGDIISTLSRPDSLLRCFEFQGDVEGEFRGIKFKNLLRAIEKSKLERCKIGLMQTQQQLQALTESIPSMKLKELELAFLHDDEGSDDEEGEFSQETIRQHLLLAIKNNFSLLSAKAEMMALGEAFDLLESAEDKQTLAFYANRNKSLDQWVDNPETVEQRKLWPDALGLAERAGPDALFRGLRSVLESDSESSKGGRKRKRPQYYIPS